MALEQTAKGYMFNKRCRRHYFNWLLDLAHICIDHNEDVKKFDDDMMHDYYSNGLTPYEAFQELLSELPVTKGGQNEIPN